MQRTLLALTLLVSACSPWPPRGPCNPEPGAGKLGSICGFYNPEDVEVVESARLLLVSNMQSLHNASGPPGHISAIPLAGPPTVRQLWPPDDAAPDASLGEASCTTPPVAARFAPHGLTSAPTNVPGVVRVAVVAHRFREAVELFDLVGEGELARLVWRACVPLPDHIIGNDVAIAPDGEIVVSNFQPAIDRLRGSFYMVKGGLGFVTGDVIAWAPKRGWRHLAGTQAAHPNGVAVSADGKLVYYAETGGQRVSRVPRAGAAPGTEAEHVPALGNPDNLSWSPRGTLLVGVHRAGMKMLKCLSGEGSCQTPWALVEIDPQTFSATELYRHEGEIVGAVASAAEHGVKLYFGPVFGDRIGVWQPPAVPMP